MTIDKGIYIKNIYYMLTYAFQQLKQNNYEDISGEDFEDIYDLFAEILIKGVSYQLKQGLHKEYIAKRDTVSTLKGKLDINGTIRNLMQRKRMVDCDFDELSENNVFNQILKTTMLLLQRNVKVDSDKDGKRNKRHELQKLLLFFGNVDTIDLTKIKWSKLRFDRNSKTYQMLLFICSFITDVKLMTTESGKYKMKSFLDERMNDLYEKFVLAYYQKHFPKLNADSTKITWNINIDNTTCMNTLPQMKTDITLTFPTRTLIIDTKYYSKTMQEHFDKSKVRNSHIYQIQSYVINEDKLHTGNVDGMLLYAKTEEEVTPNGQMALNDGNIIYFRTLDLNKDFESIKKELDSFILPYQQN